MKDKIVLEARTEEQREEVRRILGVTSIFLPNDNNDGLYVDDWIYYDEMARIVDYLREDKEPFTIYWLMDNADFEKITQIPNVEFVVEDDTTDGNDAGCIDIIYCGQYYWCLSKGTSYKEWLVTASNEYRNDAWIPSVNTIADFKRLFRVATGYDLPIKEQNA